MNIEAAATARPRAVTFDAATDEHNYEVLIHNNQDLNVRNQAVTLFGDAIYVALLEDTEHTTARALTALQALPEFTLTLIRFDCAGVEVHREDHRVHLTAEHWRRVLHIENYWLYGALFTVL